MQVMEDFFKKISQAELSHAKDCRNLISSVLKFMPIYSGYRILKLVNKETGEICVLSDGNSIVGKDIESGELCSLNENMTATNRICDIDALRVSQSLKSFEISARGLQCLTLGHKSDLYRGLGKRVSDDLHERFKPIYKEVKNAVKEKGKIGDFSYNGERDMLIFKGETFVSDVPTFFIPNAWAFKTVCCPTEITYKILKIYENL